MERAERERISRQGVVKPETPRDRSQREGLVEDLKSSPLKGRPLPVRLRNFRPAADGYIAALGGPLPYMRRLREIDEQTAAHERELVRAWAELASQVEEPQEFARRWREAAERWSFHETNDLIDRHNRWYPVESRLPMDPKRGDYALVLGHDYRRPPLDGAWVLERFPTDRRLAQAA